MATQNSTQTFTRFFAGLLTLTMATEGWADEAGSARVSPGVPAAAGVPVGTVAPKVVPAILIKKQKISTNDDPRLSAAIKALHLCEIITASYKVCIAESGFISSVDTINGIAGADNDIIAVVKKWQYKPQPMPICFVQHFEYHIDGGEACFQPERAVRWLDRRVTVIERSAPSSYQAMYQAIDALTSRVAQLEATCGAAAPKGDGKSGAGAPEVAPGQAKKLITN